MVTDLQKLLEEKKLYLKLLEQRYKTMREIVTNTRKEAAKTIKEILELHSQIEKENSDGKDSSSI